jgi:DNA adenine methylase
VTIARPFLKWAGGKHRVVSELLKITNEFSPLDCDWKVGVGSRYHEPFLGSGAMYFGMKNEGIISKSKVSYLSDLNPALINAMQVVGDAKLLESLIRILESWQNQYGKEGPVPKYSSQVVREEGMYYKKRRQMNRYLSQGEVKDDEFRVEFAALMIFLNKTCFNGLWRMNRGGLFNVPEGDYVTPRNICQEDLLRSCNQLLKGTKIERMDWRDSMKHAKPGDLVYLDPPYMPLKIGDQVFNSYYTDGFDFEDQRELALAAAVAASRGVRVIASNHDALGEPTIREIYGGSAADVGCEIDIKPIQVGRNISCKGHGRVKVNEVLIFMGPK